jgi:hypothetical protein
LRAESAARTATRRRRCYGGGSFNARKQETGNILGYKIFTGQFWNLFQVLSGLEFKYQIGKMLKQVQHDSKK